MKRRESLMMKALFLGILFSAAIACYSSAFAQTQTAQATYSHVAGDEDGFRVERKTGTGAYAVIQTLAAGATGFSDTVPNPTPGQITYCWRVIEFNAGGDAPASNEACLTTPPAVTVPAGATNLIIQFVIP